MKATAPMYPGRRDICRALAPSGARSNKAHFNGVGRAPNLHQLHAFGVLVKSSTADRHHSNLNGTVFGMHYWSECLRGQAATYRKFAEQADDPVVKRNLLELTSDCEEVANNIEDHLTGG